MAGSKKEKRPAFFNAHVHTFKLDHVHQNFLKGMFPTWLILLSIALIGLSIYGSYWLVHKLMNAELFEPLWMWLFYPVLIVLMIFFFVIPCGFILYIKIFEPKLNALLKTGIFRFFIGNLPKLIPRRYNGIERYVNLVLHAYDREHKRSRSQEDIFNNLQSYYSGRTKFVSLSMDMDYMVDNKRQKNSCYLEQLKQLAEIKKKVEYTNKFYPFIHADPRRLAEEDEDYFTILEEYIQNGSFQGIKLYPALGYFPFDRRLKPIYDLALKYKLPIMTHVAVGPVYFRGKVKLFKQDGYWNDDKKCFIHPFTGKELMGATPREFTPHFTHPMNYYYLMGEPDKLRDYWKAYDAANGIEEDYSVDDLAKYRDLKICLAHYGGSDQWERFLKDPWLPQDNWLPDEDGQKALDVHKKMVHLPGGKWVNTGGKPLVDKVGIIGKIINLMFPYAIQKWKLRDSENTLVPAIPLSWHSIISDMLSKKSTGNSGVGYFPNLYSDISYNLSNKEMLPLLKVRLERDSILKKKVLFGTDFFMVASEASEREITMNVRSYIGEENFDAIAWNNVLDYLDSDFCGRACLSEVDRKKPKDSGEEEKG